jgi:hypothetical protein
MRSWVCCWRVRILQDRAADVEHPAADWFVNEAAPPVAVAVMAAAPTIAIFPLAAHGDAGTPPQPCWGPPDASNVELFPTAWPDIAAAQLDDCNGGCSCKVN